MILFTQPEHPEIYRLMAEFSLMYWVSVMVWHGEMNYI